MWSQWEGCSSVVDKLYDCKDPWDGYLLSRERNPRWCNPVIFLLNFIFCSSAESLMSNAHAFCSVSAFTTLCLQMLKLFLLERSLFTGEWSQRFRELFARAKEKPEKLSMILWCLAISFHTRNEASLAFTSIGVSRLSQMCNTCCFSNTHLLSKWDREWCQLALSWGWEI